MHHPDLLLKEQSWLMFTLRLCFCQAYSTQWLSTIQYSANPFLRMWDSSKGNFGSSSTWKKMFLDLCCGLRLFLSNPSSFPLPYHRYWRLTLALSASLRPELSPRTWLFDKLDRLLLPTVRCSHEFACLSMQSGFNLFVFIWFDLLVKEDGRIKSLEMEKSRWMEGLPSIRSQFSPCMEEWVMARSWRSYVQKRHLRNWA